MVTQHYVDNRRTTKQSRLCLPSRFLLGSSSSLGHPVGSICRSLSHYQAWYANDTTLNSPLASQGDTTVGANNHSTCFLFELLAHNAFGFVAELAFAKDAVTTDLQTSYAVLRKETCMRSVATPASYPSRIGNISSHIIPWLPLQRIWELSILTRFRP